MFTEDFARATLLNAAVCTQLWGVTWVAPPQPVRAQRLAHPQPPGARRGVAADDRERPYAW